MNEKTKPARQDGQLAMYALGDGYICLPDVFFVTALRASSNPMDFMGLPATKCTSGKVFMFNVIPRGGAERPPRFTDPDVEVVRAERRRLVEALDAWHRQFLLTQKGDAGAPGPDSNTGEDPGGLPAPAVIVDLLSLVLAPDYLPTEEDVLGWSIRDAQRAVAWAGSVHLRASDNDDVDVPSMPGFLYAEKAGTGRRAGRRGKEKIGHDQQSSPKG